MRKTLGLPGGTPAFRLYRKHADVRDGLYSLLHRLAAVQPVPGDYENTHDYTLDKLEHDTVVQAIRTMREKFQQDIDIINKWKPAK